MKRTPPKEAAAPAGRELALLCAEAAGDGKAIDTVILDMRSVSSIADYFVICGGSSNRQAKAIAERVERVVGGSQVRAGTHIGHIAHNGHQIITPAR